MDSIDITDSGFSLDVPNLNQVIDNVNDIVSNDYTMYIYIGAVILIIIIGIFIFKFYQNKKREQSGDDCEGGFCTMNQKSQQI